MLRVYYSNSNRSWPSTLNAAGDQQVYVNFDNQMTRRCLPAYGCLPLRPYLKARRSHKGSTLTGDIRTHTIASKVVESRDVLVYLPPGYSDHGGYSYPYAILQDGQNVFDAKTAVFGVEWGVDETAETLIVNQKIAPIILVAVYNSPERIVEYTPIPDPQNGGGGAAAYETFLLEELLPFLEATYSLSRRAEERAVIGSSLGGLLALHLGWRHPKQFGLVGAMSPSLWWARRGVITAMAGCPPPDPLPRIWLDGGTHETDTDENGNGVPDLLDDLRTMRAVLLAQGYQLDKNFTYLEVEGGEHNEASWSARVGDVLKAFFPKPDVFRAW